MKTIIPQSQDIISSIDKIILHWHEVEPKITTWESVSNHIPVSENAPFSYIESITRINTYQWHEEDKARDVSATDFVIADLKRSIDRSNQRRVDEIEKLDQFFEKTLFPTPQTNTQKLPLNSETPGCLIDRLSIIGLKIYHTGDQLKNQALRPEARAKFEQRLTLQREQQKDLCGCFDELISDITNGKRSFKTYFQFKTYNDPETNPYLRKK